MKRFLAECGRFLAIQVLLWAGFEGVYQHYLGADHYLAAFRDKARRLAQTPSPRLLLVGGSSDAFGLNSKALARSLKRPVVNLGLNAGLGLEFMLRQAEAAMKPGDVVVLTPEYHLLSDYRFDASTLWQTLSFAPQAVRYLSASDLPTLLDGGLAFVVFRLHAIRALVLLGPPESMYRRSGFDRDGDFVAHHGLPSQGARGNHEELRPLQAAGRARDRLALFDFRAKASGARVFLSPAPIPIDDSKRQAAPILELWSMLERETGIPVLATERGYSRKLFLDTAYHLTLAGKRARTRSLIAALRGPLGMAPD